MAALKDPYSLVHDALWALLEANADFAAMVQPGNRIKYDKRKPIKEEVSTSDFPEVRIVIRSSEPHPRRTSNSSSDLVVWEVQTHAGDMRLQTFHFPLRWIVYRALRDVHPELTKLVWRNFAFVRLARPTAVQDGVAIQDIERGIVGWASIWACETELWFPTELLS